MERAVGMDEGDELGEAHLAVDARDLDVPAGDPCKDDDLVRFLDGLQVEEKEEEMEGERSSRGQTMGVRCKTTHDSWGSINGFTLQHPQGHVWCTHTRDERAHRCERTQAAGSEARGALL